MITAALCAALNILPQSAEAQVSANTANLLRAARVQVLNQPVTPNDFSLRFLSGGSAFLSSFKGKIVILNFWATWCPPCRAEMPSMEKLYQLYKDKGFEILAVDLGESDETVSQFIKRGNFTFPVMMDSNNKIGIMYGIESIPTSFILNREGKIIARVVGSIHWDSPSMIAAVEELLK